MGPALADGGALAHLAAISDGLIALSSFAIAASLGFLWVRIRGLVAFSSFAAAGAVFSFVCGASHLVDAAAAPSSPDSSSLATIKVLGALVALAIAVALPPLIPRVLRLVDQPNLPVRDDGSPARARR